MEHQQRNHMSLSKKVLFICSGIVAMLVASWLILVLYDKYFVLSYAQEQLTKQLKVPKDQVVVRTYDVTVAVHSVPYPLDPFISHDWTLEFSVKSWGLANQWITAEVLEPSYGTFKYFAIEDMGKTPWAAIPSYSDVRDFTVLPSALPGAKRTTITDESTIARVLTWLRNAKEVGTEKPGPAKGGYPGGLPITTKEGDSLLIGLAMNWTITKLDNGNTLIQGKKVADYVALRTNSKSVRLYSPELYKWITRQIGA